MPRRCYCLVAGFLLLLLSTGCQQQTETSLRFAGATMGTTWSVVLHPATGVDAAGLRRQLHQRLDQINALMSTYDPDSEISRFNRTPSSEWFAVSAETAQVITLSQEVSRLTGGAFDISVGPLVDLWGFGAAERGGSIPTADQVRAALDRVGYERLAVRRVPAAIRKEHPGMRIDLSAVAKGYAVDALAELLDQHRITNFLVEIGGDMKLAGHREDGTPWRIALEKPVDHMRAVETILPLPATALATSGNYRNFYEEGGQRYVHTIAPFSGWPIQHKLASVTVLDPSAARADALATALMVMGEEQGRLFCENHRIAAYFLIHDNAQTISYASPALQSLLDGVQP
ncbi:MAG: FAD:protein FMN transferase [Pelovirga sp.]